MIDIYLKMLCALLFVLVILGFFYFILRKRLNLNSTNAFFQILEYKSFGPKSGVMALKFGDKILLLTITPTNISLIGQFEAKEVEQKEQSMEDIVQKVKRLKESLNELN